MTDRAPAPPLVWRFAVLGLGHAGMLGMMHLLLETFEPDPNGFRFDTFEKFSSFAVLTVGPVVVGLASQSRRAAVLAAGAQLLSPLALLGAMRDPASDLNFALFLWWIPMPLIVLLIVWIDDFIVARN